MESEHPGDALVSQLDRIGALQSALATMELVPSDVCFVPSRVGIVDPTPVTVSFTNALHDDSPIEESAAARAILRRASRHSVVPGSSPTRCRKSSSSKAPPAGVLPSTVMLDGLSFSSQDALSPSAIAPVSLRPSFYSPHFRSQSRLEHRPVTLIFSPLAEGSHSVAATATTSPLRAPWRAEGEDDVADDSVAAPAVSVSLHPKRNSNRDIPPIRLGTETHFPSPSPRPRGSEDVADDVRRLATLTLSVQSEHRHLERLRTRLHWQHDNSVATLGHLDGALQEETERLTSLTKSLQAKHRQMLQLRHHLDAKNLALDQRERSLDEMARQLRSVAATKRHKSLTEQMSRSALERNVRALHHTPRGSVVEE